jgi:hypothetical protein
VVHKPAFSGSVNGSPTINFVPSTSTSGGKTSLIGTTSSYTVTLTFPVSTGAGSFFYSSTITASIFDGSSTYVANGSKGSGSITIDSIPNGNYYGSFQFIGEDPSLNTTSVNGGSFSNL